MIIEAFEKEKYINTLGSKNTKSEGFRAYF